MDFEFDYIGVNSVLYVDMFVLLFKVCEFLVVNVVFVLLLSKLLYIFIGFVYMVMEFDDLGCWIMNSIR